MAARVQGSGFRVQKSQADDLSSGQTDGSPSSKPTVRRSSRWPRVAKAHLAQHGSCAVCGRMDELVVHHIVPVHVDATKELDPENLITLCEGATLNCHLWAGHLGNWASWNKSIIKDAARLLKRFLLRPF